MIIAEIDEGFITPDQIKDIGLRLTKKVNGTFVAQREKDVKLKDVSFMEGYLFPTNIHF